MATPAGDHTTPPGRRLLFVRHSVPRQAPDVPAREWRLSDEGAVRARALARHVAIISRPALLASSDEPKARDTAAILGAALGLDARVVPDLREHDRTGVAYRSPEDFTAVVARFFAHPAERVFGAESAAEALARVSSAVSGLIAAAPSGDILIVTHGTVLSLFVAATTGADAAAFWRRLPLPALAVLRPRPSDDGADPSAAAPWRLDALWPPDGWERTPT
jgi:broad specificity phosphatase PhoE